MGVDRSSDPCPDHPEIGDLAAEGAKKPAIYAFLSRAWEITEREIVLFSQPRSAFCVISVASRNFIA